MAANSGQTDLLADAIARGMPAKLAVRLARVSERTARRRLQESDFRQLVLERRARFVDDAAGKLAATTRKAAHCPRELLDSSSDQIRLAAARAILEAATKLTDVVDHEARLTALEQAKRNECRITTPEVGTVTGG